MTMLKNIFEDMKKSFSSIVVDEYTPSVGPSQRSFSLAWDMFSGVVHCGEVIQGLLDLKLDGSKSNFVFDMIENERDLERFMFIHAASLLGGHGAWECNVTLKSTSGVKVPVRMVCFNVKDAQGNYLYTTSHLQFLQQQQQ
eukprot:Clim_evm55s136 gene=Clim_evmTU55s136